MKPDKKPKRTLFIVTPVWGAYEVVQEMIEAVEKNTKNSYYHLMLNDNHPDSLKERFKTTENIGVIDVYNDPEGATHVEQIGKMMDLGLAFGKNFMTFDYLVKLESDCIVQPNWDEVLMQEMNDKTALIEAYSVDTELGEEPVVPEPSTYTKDWTEMNCCMFHPRVMNYNWCFSMVPHSVDILLSRHLRTLTDELELLETTKTWIKHYRSSSRKDYDKS